VQFTTIHNALNGLLKINAHTRTNGRVASQRTTASYGEVLHAAFDTLHELGYKIQNPENLKEEHVRVLCNYWYDNGKKISTIQDYLSKLRVFGGWIGKKKMVKPLQHYLPNIDKSKLVVRKVAVESKGWSENGVDIVEKIRQADAIDHRFGLMLRMMLAFGLRRKEVVHNRPWKADKGDKLVIFFGEAKGGRPRDIYFDTPEQRRILDYVKSTIPKSEYLGWPTTRDGNAATLEQNVGRYNRAMAKIGITKLQDGVTGHGLRAQYAENAALIAGMIPPTMGGTKGQMDSASLELTRADISAKLGHVRASITGAYFGSFGRNSTPDEVDRCKVNIERGLRGIATRSLSTVPSERLVDCLQLVGELDVIGVAATTRQVYYLWMLHSARFATEWVAPGSENVQAIEVQAAKCFSN